MSTVKEHGPREGLRDRRRRETSLEICLAALHLFEQKGISGTTVDEIAERAGLSARTFFRLAGTKEDAVFIDDRWFDEALDEFLGVGLDTFHEADLSALMARVRQLPLRALKDLDADDQARDRYLRVRRLIAHEPALLAAAVRRDQVVVDQIVHALVNQAGCEEMVARVTAEFAGLEMRLTLDQWARHDDAGRAVALVDIHRAVLRELARVAS